MRNFIFDVWVWSKAKHSRLLKQIRVKALSFPSDMFCLNEAAKDADVSPYMKSDEFEVTNNAVCQSGVTTEIPINQAYIGGDTANISINVII